MIPVTTFELKIEDIVDTDKFYEIPLNELKLIKDDYGQFLECVNFN